MKEGAIIETCKKKVGDKTFLKIYKRKKDRKFSVNKLFKIF